MVSGFAVPPSAAIASTASEIVALAPIVSARNLLCIRFDIRDFPGEKKTGVIPAKAGIQLLGSSRQEKGRNWIPAFAGMTSKSIALLI
jgi:hypothetical protein